jgi:NTP pyrophosphatase (non-canonical NTP hydrolase)
MTDVDSLTNRLLAFRDARAWKRFHSARNLAASLSIEAAELLEIFQWDTEDEAVDAVRRRRIAEELADIGIYALLLAHEAGIDLPRAIDDKITENERKYPVDKARGRSTKYTEL